MFVPDWHYRLYVGRKSGVNNVPNACLKQNSTMHHHFLWSFVDNEPNQCCVGDDAQHQTGITITSNGFLNIHFSE
jgi:hypothetical protein